MTKPSLKSLVGGKSPTPPAEAAPEAPKSYRVAKTRLETRSIGGHFAPEAIKTLGRIANEHDRDKQELLAEALNMLFQRYGESYRIETISGRRKRS
jgi:antitoxin-like ribbon-helix-helix protein